MSGNSPHTWGSSALTCAHRAHTWGRSPLVYGKSPHASGKAVPGSTIVRTGPYRLSRNPIYLAFSLLQLGLSFWVNSLALLITLIPAVALMQLVVIPREERYLEARFTSEYLPYKSSVRRWL